MRSCGGNEVPAIRLSRVGLRYQRPAWRIFGGFDEGHLYSFGRQPRSLFLRFCAEFQRDIYQIIRRKWGRIDAF